MGCGLGLEVPAALIPIELASQCPLDIARTRIVPFNQVAVMGVHHPNELSQTRPGAWME
jgi:hypothetical protein